MQLVDVIVIGGGASGFFAAINYAQMTKGASVLIVEKSSKVLSKVRVSGGRRCNVTHACFDNGLLVKNYPRGEKELHNVFSRFTTTNTLEWFALRGVKLKTEQDGRIFPETNNSETIIQCLLKEAEKYGVQLKLNEDVQQISVNEEDTFILKTGSANQYHCKRLVVATGGNAKEAGYEWLKAIGHTVVKPVPSLFTFNLPDHEITKLMGVAVPFAKIKIKETKQETEGAVLITHWGLSGPAILKSSAIAARKLNELNYNFHVIINWLPRYNEEKVKVEFANQRNENPAKAVITSCPFDLPKRLWEFFVSSVNIDKHCKWADVTKKNLLDLLNILINNEFKVKGKTTFKEEFVTCGGIQLKEVNLSTMQSKRIPGLYFTGEVLDIDGITGGFNFQHAWSSAWVAAQHLSIQKSG